MFTDTTIYGYVTDGAAYHPQCLPDDINPAADDSVSGLFNWHESDWAEGGLSCDFCGEYIFEPDYDLEPEDDREPIPAPFLAAFGQLSLDELGES